MYFPLLIIALASLLCMALGWAERWAGAGRVIAVVGVWVALGVALWREGIEGGRVLGTTVGWPQALSWLGEPIYRTDALSAGLGIWCLLLGGLCLLKMGANEEPVWKLAISTLTIGTLYSVAHTDNLLAFAGQTLGLTLLAWAYRIGDAGDSETANSPAQGKQLFALGVGALMLLGAVLLMGRTTGGDYSLVRMSLSALTVWPLVLLIGFAIAWLGLLPFAGWSGEGRTGVGATTALVQSLVVGLPATTLLFRLEALLSAQALAVTVPDEWRAFTTALAWLGGLTALVSAAGLLAWAGDRGRWTALLTAHSMGLAAWGQGLDTPPGRYAALAIVLAYGAGRVTLLLIGNGESTPQRATALASLAAVPVTAGFVGVWLLGGALQEAGRPILVIALAGMVILAACGTVLHPALTRSEKGQPGKWAAYVGWLGVASAGALILGGTLPGLWLPLVKSMASVAGGNSGVSADWVGLQAQVGISAPLLLLLAGGIIVIGLGWLVALFTRAKATSSGTLLPTALERLVQTRTSENKMDDISLQPLLENAPAPVWWLSPAWLEAGIFGTGSILGRLGERSGNLLGRLEGRFYLPLALILALLLVLAVTR